MLFGSVMEGRLWAVERGIAPAQTPEEHMLMGKRAPSSLVQLITPIGYVVVMLCAWMVFRASMPAWIPRMPS